MKYSYVPAPKSIYKDIKKLEAGSLIYVDVNNKNIKSLTLDSQENFIKCLKKPFQEMIQLLNVLEEN